MSRSVNMIASPIALMALAQSGESLRWAAPACSNSAEAVSDPINWADAVDVDGDAFPAATLDRAGNQLSPHAGPHFAARAWGRC